MSAVMEHMSAAIFVLTQLVGTHVTAQLDSGLAQTLKDALVKFL